MGRLMLFVFSLATPSAHWAAVYRFSVLSAEPVALGYVMDAIACVGMAVASGLNAWAAVSLGEVRTLEKVQRRERNY